jgi:hypothetical protein
VRPSAMISCIISSGIGVERKSLVECLEAANDEKFLDSESFIYKSPLNLL